MTSRIKPVCFVLALSFSMSCAAQSDRGSANNNSPNQNSPNQTHAASTAQPAPEATPPSAPDIDKEAKTLFEAWAHTKFRKCGDKWISKRNDMLLTQMKGVMFSWPRVEKLTELDKLNGYEYKAEFYIMIRLTRDYYPKAASRSRVEI